jgi:hypothetical protein
MIEDTRALGPEVFTSNPMQTFQRSGRSYFKDREPAKEFCAAPPALPDLVPSASRLKPDLRLNKVTDRLPAANQPRLLSIHQNLGSAGPGIVV